VLIWLQRRLFAWITNVRLSVSYTSARLARLGFRACVRGRRAHRRRVHGERAALNYQSSSLASSHTTFFDPVTLPALAEIVTDVSRDTRLHVTSPAVTVATVEALEVQVAVAVRFLVAPVAKVPVAVSCTLPPGGISPRFVGVMEIDFSCGAWQVTPTDPLTLPLVAEIVDDPLTVALALQVTRPLDDTVATLGTLELHWTELVRLCEGPEEKMPVAVNCAVPPLGRVNGAGETTTEVSTGAWQVTVVEPVVVPVAVAPVAEIVAAPAVVALGLQLTSPADTPATLGALEAHVAVAVRFCVEESVYVPVAVNCVEAPAATWGAAGVTAIDAKAMTFTVACVMLVMLLPGVAEHMSCAE
jgi:hypothetical protein